MKSAITPSPISLSMSPPGVPDGIGRDAVVRVEQARELGGRHRLGKAGRAAHVGEEHGELDLGAAGILRGGTEARVAQLRVARILAEAEQRHDRSGDPAVRRLAELAPRIRREAEEEAVRALEEPALAEQHLPPLVLVERLRPHPASVVSRRALRYHTMPRVNEQQDARRWVVLAVGLLGLTAGCAAQYGLAFLIPALRAEGLTLEAATLLVTAPIAGILCTLIAWGAAADRWGERRILTLGLAIAGLAELGAASVDEPVQRWLLLFLVGASSASIHAASGRLILGWFGAPERGLAMGIRQMGQPLGVGLAAIVLPPLAVAGVGTALAALGVACLALGGPHLARRPGSRSVSSTRPDRHRPRPTASRTCGASTLPAGCSSSRSSP